MFKFRRWWLLCGAVLVGVVALNGVVNGVVEAKPAPAPRAVCVRGGAKARDAVSGRGLVCVQTKVRGLRWRFQPTSVTTTTTTTSPTTTTTTVPGVVAPVLVSVSASDGVQITVAGMRPDTGVYSLQWVPYGQTFNTYQMARATSPSMNVPAGWFACNRTYTFRVFVMQADWQLADGHQTQNVTHHSIPFDVVMPACPAATVPAVTCADGGVCIVGDTGPGGGIVFYVQAAGGTFACGETLASTCKYLEAAPTSGTSAWTASTYGWSGNTSAPIGPSARGEAVGAGYKNTEAIVTQSAGGSTPGKAGTAARAYRGPNNLSDWYLPSKDELNQMCKWQGGLDWISDATVCTGGTPNSGPGASGFSTGGYWSSSEGGDGAAWLQDFPFGDQLNYAKDYSGYVRPVRAFGGTVACADGGVCVVGDTGPGGGVVFYVASSNFTSTGSDCGTTCKYLEAATSDQSTGIVWATTAEKCWNTAAPSGDGSNNNSCQSFSIYSPHDTPNQADSRTAATEIGKGMANTNAIYDRFNSAGAAVATNTYAAGIAWAYDNNSKTDWHLPSKDELNELFFKKDTVGGFSTAGYWSSSENAANGAWLQNFTNGDQIGGFKLDTFYVRPVRAFG